MLGHGPTRECPGWRGQGSPSLGDGPLETVTAGYPGATRGTAVLAGGCEHLPAQGVSLSFGSTQDITFPTSHSKSRAWATSTETLLSKPGEEGR